MHYHWISEWRWPFKPYFLSRFPDEMLGFYGEHSNSTLPAPHANKLNDLVVSSSYPSQDHTNSVRTANGSSNRLLARKSQYPTMAARVPRHGERFAYPQKSISELSIVDLGNALSHFEELDHSHQQVQLGTDTVGGDPNAISEQAKVGAIVFYGKGRCAACHCATILSRLPISSRLRLQ